MISKILSGAVPGVDAYLVEVDGKGCFKKLRL
jgi:hypothetical protein